MPRLNRLYTLCFVGICTLAAVCTPYQVAVAQSVPVTCPIQDWAQTYDGAGHGEDSIAGLVADADGNVFATGSVMGQGDSNFDWVTIAYSASGERVWTRTFDGPGQTNGTNIDRPRGIALDDTGNVYVTGVSTSATAFDYLTTKYSPTGAKLWEQRYNGSTVDNGNPHDEPVDIEVTNSRVIVSGVSATNTGAIEIATLLYDLDGNLLRELRHEGEVARAVKTDTQDNIYVLGDAYKENTYNDILLIKYGPNGDLQWEKSYGLADADHAVGMVIDAVGNIYVTGNLTRVDQNYVKNIVLLKYSAGGTLLWSRTYGATVDSFAVAAAITLDSQGNPIVAGSVSGGSLPMLIMYYTVNGDLRWQRAFSAGDSRDITAVAVDSADTIFVTGGRDAQVYGNVDHFTTVSYSNSGVLRWIARHDGNRAQSTALVVDDEGNVIVGGAANDDTVVVKYGRPDSTSALFASASNPVVGEGDHEYENPVTFRVDLSRPAPADVHIDYQVYQFIDEAMQPVNADPRPLSIPQGSSSGEIYTSIPRPDTEPDNPRRLYLRLSCSPDVIITNPEVDAIIVDDDQPVNTFLWRTDIPNAGEVVALSVDDDGNAYVGSNNGMTVYKFDRDGNQLWGRTQAGAAADLELDGQGNVLLIGEQPSASFRDMAIQKYDANGNLQWSQLLAGTGGDLDRGTALTTDRQGNVFATGIMWQRHSAARRSDGDFVTVALDPAGNLRWKQDFDGGVAGQEDAGTAIALDGAGNVLVGGYTGESTGRRATVLKYTADGSLVWRRSDEQSPPDQQSWATDIAITRGGSIAMLAWFVAMYSGDGTLLWRWPPPYWTDFGYSAFTVDSLGNIIATGYGGYNQEFILSKFTPQGQVAWQKTIAGQPGQNDAGEAVAVDDLDNAYVVGRTNRNFTTLAYDENGTRRWRQELGAGVGTAVAVDSQHNVYVAGQDGQMANAVLAKYAPLPPFPTVTIGNIVAVEAVSKTTQATFIIELSTPVDHDLQLTYSAVAGTAIPGIDYVDTAGSMVIPAHTTSVSIPVTILSDDAAEAAEFFYLNLAGADDVYFADSQGKGVIVDLGANLNYLPVISR